MAKGCVHIAGAVICGGDSPEYDIVVRGERIHFEVHYYSGPTPITKRGDVLSLGPRHPFWAAASLWMRQGKRIGSDGVCIWEPAPDPMANATHLWGRHYYLGPPEEAAAFKARIEKIVADKQAKRRKRRPDAD